MTCCARGEKILQLLSMDGWMAPTTPESWADRLGLVGVLECDGKTRKAWAEVARRARRAQRGPAQIDMELPAVDEHKDDEEEDDDA